MGKYSSNGEIRRNQKNRERAIEQRLSVHEFAARAEVIHSSYYDYSKVNYVTSKEKVEIICPEHGSFWQTPSAHLQGQRCPKCAKFLSSIKRKSLNSVLKRRGLDSVKEFLEKCEKKRTHIIPESIKDYWKNHTIRAVCDLHGEFEASPGFYLKHKFDGCTKCGKESKAKKNSKRNKGSITSLKEFTDKSNRIHNSKYSYDLTVIQNGVRDKVKIVCPIHGVFSQKAADHLQGNGCQKCANFSTSVMEQDWLKSLGVREEYWQKWVKLKEKRIKVDAYNPETNTIYEFFGDFWHGNPEKYPTSEINPRNKRRYGDLYKDTMNRVKLIKESGYNLVFIWESQYKET